MFSPLIIIQELSTLLTSWVEYSFMHDC